MSDFSCTMNDFRTEVDVDWDRNPVPEPGVYAWRVRGTDRYVRIGKSNSNVIKRALEHVNGDYPDGYTYKIMGKYFRNNSLELDIYVLDEKDKKYRILALEDYLEKTCEPIIRSGTRNPPNDFYNKAIEAIEAAKDISILRTSRRENEGKPLLTHAEMMRELGLE